MIIFVHLAFDIIIYLLLGKLIPTNLFDLILLFSINLIDLDHLFAKPIYHPKRNPFITHFLHKPWKILLIITILTLFFRPILFLGIGLLSHLFLDYLYVKILIKH